MLALKISLRYILKVIPFSEVLLILLFLASVCQLASATPRLRIGVIAPLSGSLVASGEAFRNGIILAKELYDKEGLVEFVFEDDGFSPKNSVAIAKKFIAEKKEAIMIFGTPTAFAVVPITEQAQMPLAAVTIVDKVVQDKQYAVRHFVAWQEENRRAVEEVKRRGYKRIAIVTTINDATFSLRDGFIKDTSVQVVLSEEYVRDNMDFQSVAVKIKSLQPDAIYHLLFAPQGSAFMKQLRAIGCNVPVFAAHNVEDPSEVMAAQGSYEGIWFVTGDDRAAGRIILEAYVKKFKHGPAMGGWNGFDYAKMVIEAAQKNVPVLSYLKQLKDFEGVFGRYGAAPGNTFDLKATVKVIRNGQFEFAE